MRALLFCLLTLAWKAGFACSGLAVEDAWIREAPPGAGVMAAYATLRNTGAQPLTIMGARATDFGSAEIHRSEMKDGRMRMEAVPRLLLEPGASVSLKPGELHLMLFDPKRALKAGDRSTIRFDCEQGSVSAPFRVRREE